MPDKEKVIVYGLGYYWKEKFDEISTLFDIIACSDQDERASEYVREYPFILPDQISKFSYDKIILGCKKRSVRAVSYTHLTLPTTSRV